MPWHNIAMTKSELAYLRHKAYTLGYKYITVREVAREDLFGGMDYVFMSGIEQEKVLDILEARLRHGK